MRQFRDTYHNFLNEKKKIVQRIEDLEAEAPINVINSNYGMMSRSQMNNSKMAEINLEKVKLSNLLKRAFYNVDNTVMNLINDENYLNMISDEQMQIALSELKFVLPAFRCVYFETESPRAKNLIELLSSFLEDDENLESQILQFFNSDQQDFNSFKDTYWKGIFYLMITGKFTKVLTFLNYHSLVQTNQQ